MIGSEEHEPVALNFANEFVVAAPIDVTWQALLDLQRVAGCLPGASIDPADSDGTFKGRMRVKLGAVTMDYEGVAEIADVDEEARRVRFHVRGREVRGQGTASAEIANTLLAQGDTTHVLVETVLSVTGRPAQFGRGIMQGVAASMLADFASSLSEMIAAEPSASANRSG